MSEAHNWKKLFFDLAEKMNIEKHLLPQKPEDLLEQFKNGLSAIAFCDNEIVGHTTIWNIAPGWYEIGSTYTDPKHRRKYINENLYKKLLEKHADKNILETTTNEYSIKAGKRLGFVIVKRNSLPQETFRGACICSFKKTASSNPIACCKLAWDGDTWEKFADWLIPCHIRVTKETYERNKGLQIIKSFTSEGALVVT